MTRMMPSMWEDTPGVRHKFGHTTALCQNSNGWVHVDENEDHIHQWGGDKGTAMFEHVYECIVDGCEMRRTYDSSG